MSDNVDSEDEDVQRRYKRQILRELYAWMRNKHISTRDGGYRCPFCNHKLHHAYQSVLAHARGRAVGSFKKKYARRVKHGAYAEYRRSFRTVLACEMRCGMDQTMYAWVCLMTIEVCTYGWTMLMYVYACYLCLSMFNLCLLMSNRGIWMQLVRLMESTSILV